MQPSTIKFQTKSLIESGCTRMSHYNSRRYNLSFTAASLRPELARIVAETFLAEGNWNVAKDRILSSNALQCRSPNSAVRMERELRQRLGTLTGEQITLLAQAAADDRAAMAWLAACKHSGFLFDFAAEVLREKIAVHDSILRPSDYESFVDTKTALHSEFARLTGSSKAKVRRVLLRMLTEAGLLSAGTVLGIIRRPLLSAAVLHAITSDSPRWLAGFLVPDTEIRAL